MAFIDPAADHRSSKRRVEYGFGDIHVDGSDARPRQFGFGPAAGAFASFIERLLGDRAAPTESW